MTIRYPCNLFKLLLFPLPTLETREILLLVLGRMMCKSLRRNVRIHTNSITNYCNNIFVITNYYQNRVNYLNCLRVIRTCK